LEQRKSRMRTKVLREELAALEMRSDEWENRAAMWKEECVRLKCRLIIADEGDGAKAGGQIIEKEAQWQRNEAEMMKTIQDLRKAQADAARSFAEEQSLSEQRHRELIAAADSRAAAAAAAAEVHVAELAKKAETIEQLRADVISASTTITGGAVSMIKTLMAVPLLQQLTDEELAAIAGAVAVENFGPDATIVTEGQPGESMFIIVDGDAQASVQGEVVAHFAEGDFFGELALLTGKPRTATVRCETGAQCLVLDSASFDVVAANNEWIFEERLRGYESTRQEAQGLLQFIESELPS
jgi:hypothetical protein